MNTEKIKTNTPKPPNKKFIRIKGLDFLRGIAIILVLFRHSAIENTISFFGWLGVDLFFVLSGFLVSGLLFNEYKKRGKVRIKRFLIRRGFKIYPSFYILIIFSIIFYYFQTHSFYPLDKILSEIFYLQSYGPRIWDQTWSLAVEEHFYIFLAIIIYFIVKKNKLEDTKKFILTIIILLIISFLMRLYISLPHIDEYYTFYKTHLRTDGILIGVLISYLYHFTNFYKFFDKHRLKFFIAAIILILPGFFFEGGYFVMNTIGLTVVNLGFGIFVFLGLKKYDVKIFNNFILKIIFNLICLIGVHSYSIYLWHLFIRDEISTLNLSQTNSLILFFVLSIVIGIGISYLIEKPILAIRNKIIA